MKKSILFYCFAGLLFYQSLAMQQEGTSSYLVRTIAFYNLENLFDTRNDSLIFDDARTPNGKDRWTSKRYQHKIENLAEAILLIGKDIRGSSPDIIGLCELENYQVIQDVFSQAELQDEDYQFIHYDSPDERGIDVALAYRKSVFVPYTHRSHRLLLENEKGFRDYTRDLLVVGGMFDKDELFILVNHWPSRSGGKSRSRPYREAAARLNKRVLDSIRKLDPESRIIVMGDFNDNPTDRSIKKLLKTRKRQTALNDSELYNPMEELYRRGIGSLGYRDQWHLFDQILLSENLLGPLSGHFFFWKAGIFNPAFLSTQEGPYSGYPKRTYAAGVYQGGYSDHFPVFVYLIKKVQNR